MNSQSAATNEPVPRAIQRIHFVARLPVLLTFAMIVLSCT